eukprot:1391604-Amorphochlora_amoeboformis.AAC.2
MPGSQWRTLEGIDREIISAVESVGRLKTFIGKYPNLFSWKGTSGDFTVVAKKTAKIGSNSSLRALEGTGQREHKRRIIEHKSRIIEHKRRNIHIDSKLAAHRLASLIYANGGSVRGTQWLSLEGIDLSIKSAIQSCGKLKRFILQYPALFTWTGTAGGFTIIAKKAGDQMEINWNSNGEEEGKIETSFRVRETMDAKIESSIGDKKGPDEKESKWRNWAERKTRFGDTKESKRKHGVTFQF